jgi:OOP family OmpA-OmpF porin
MNNSTLKKSSVLTLVSLAFIGMAFAQTNNSTSTKKTSMSDSVKTPKLFGGTAQYNTWSVGANIGITAPVVATGGTDVFTGNNPSFGYGVTVKKQLTHTFSLRFDLSGGKVSGSESAGFLVPNPASPTETVNVTSFTTSYISGSLNGVFNFGNINFLKRKNGINFYTSGGLGLIDYAPQIFFPSGSSGTSYDFKGHAGNNKTATYIHEMVIPVGVGVKFKLTDKLDLNVGYTENFVDGYNFEGVKEKYPAKNKYSFGYGGIEYTFGPKNKTSLEWVNPVALMYDELYDAALRQEVEALKGRVKTVEKSIDDLKKDSDGDGVADQFDKCPNTPAGTVVDGSGCIIIFPVDTAKDDEIDTSKLSPDESVVNGKIVKATPFSKISFEFDSSVLTKASYPALEATVEELKKTGKTITIAGYASSEGTSSHNMSLSKDRANAIKNYLLKGGVPAKQIKLKGYGETHPIADNSTEDGRKLNRRVEFIQ